jgi:penicillin G amidase
LLNGLRFAAETSWMTQALKYGAVIALVSLAGLSIVAALLFTSAWPASGRCAIDGLGAPVAVYRDAWSIPHIFAQSDEDASFALGWVHAEDRLWHMETMRRLGAGRLAEIFGRRGLSSDRWMRTLGLHRLAERDYAALSSETKRKFDAYARGVNAWLTARSGLLPPEFLLLRFEPEPWTPADSLIWLKLMALRLSGNRHEELLRARLAERLTPQQLRDLWPEDPPDAPTTLAAIAATESDATALTRLPAALPESSRPYGASNAWVVSGSKTASGKPILANDPHLGFALPAPWYLTRIVTQSGELAGATAPGFPAMVLGHNKRIAWGITSSHVDVEDVFFERVDPDDPTRYEAPDGRRPFVTRKEMILIRDAPADTMVVRSTRHGPVISDVTGGALFAPPLRADESGRATLVAALLATYLGGDDRTAEALFALNKAGNWHEFLSAAKDATAPQQNVFYADIDGHIGFTSAGLIPIRSSNSDGRMPVQGWTGVSDWIGFIPFEDIPKVLDPRSGRLVNANNRPMPLDYPWPIEGDWDAGFRAARIAGRLAEATPQTIESTAALQLDSVSLMARRLVPLMLDRLPRLERHSEVIERLRSWDGQMRHDSPEPLIFSAWLREVVRALCRDELGPAFDNYWDYSPRFVQTALTESPRWCDDVGTDEVEDCPSRLALALTTALEKLSDNLGADSNKWRWGDVHRASFNNRFWDRIPMIGRLASTSLAIDGGNDTINRAASRISDLDDPFVAVHGASFRAIYDLAELGNSVVILATGQSGNPFSRHYRDMMPLWRDGLGIRLNATRHELEREAESSLRMVPLSQSSRP